MSALGLLSGDAQTFRTKVWASRVHLHHTDPGLLTALLSLDDVDQLLTSNAIRTPAVRLAQDGAVLSESRYTRNGSLAGRPLTGLVDARKVLDLFEAGASVVLQGLQRYWPPLSDLVTALETELGHPCQANAYLTPPASQGFAVHSDTHDVFVFQTHGRKSWEVWEETSDGGDRVRQQVLMQPGSSMYLPTGTPHSARADDTASLHVTVGINQVTWRQLLQRVVDRALGEIDAGHLPAGYLHDPGVLHEGLSEHLADLAERLRTADPTLIEQEQVRSFLSSRPPRLRGGLHDRLALSRIDAQTILRRRPGRPVRLQEDGDRIAVLLGDRVLRVPSWLRPALLQLADRETLSPADLALDLPSSLVLCRRLVREGLLEVGR